MLFLTSLSLLVVASAQFKFNTQVSERSRTSHLTASKEAKCGPGHWSLLSEKKSGSEPFLLENMYGPRQFKQKHHFTCSLDTSHSFDNVRQQEEWESMRQHAVNMYSKQLRKNIAECKPTHKTPTPKNSYNFTASSETANSIKGTLFNLPGSSQRGSNNNQL